MTAVELISETLMNELVERFKRASRWLPAMPKTKEAVKTVIQSTARLSNKRRALWDKLVKADGDCELNDMERMCLPSVLFDNVDDERPMLALREPLFEKAVSHFEAAAAPEEKEDLVRFFFSSYPADALREDVRHALRGLLERADLLTAGLAEALCADGAKRFAGQFVLKNANPEEPFNTIIEREANGLIHPEGRFAQLAWRDSIDRYPPLIVRALQRTEKTFDSLKKTLSFIRSDALLDGQKLRAEGSEQALAFAILNPFLDYRNTPVTEEIENLLYELLISFLGNPNNPAYARRWAPVQERFAELAHIWRMGRSLIASFDLVDRYLTEIVPQSGTTTWSGRKDFWLSYWRADRINACRIGIPKKYLSDTRKLATDLRSVRLAESVGADSGKAVLLIALDNNSLVAAEFSHNGSLLLLPYSNKYFGNARIPITDIRDRCPLKHRIKHYSGWQLKADSLIQDLTDLQPPRR